MVILFRREKVRLAREQVLLFLTSGLSVRNMDLLCHRSLILCNSVIHTVVHSLNIYLALDIDPSLEYARERQL